MKPMGPARAGSATQARSLRWRTVHKGRQDDGRRLPPRCPGLHDGPRSSWLRMLDDDAVDTVVLNRWTDRGLLRLLCRTGAWRVDFADRDSLILVRREAQYRSGVSA